MITDKNIYCAALTSVERCHGHCCVVINKYNELVLQGRPKQRILTFALNNNDSFYNFSCDFEEDK